MEINGLPLHPLMVHAAVVFGPVAALVALVYVAVGRWSDRLRWPMVVLAVLATLTIVGAYLSGDHFREANDFFAGNKLIDEHEELADKLLWVTIAFGVIGLGTGVWHPRAGAGRVVAGVLLVIAAVATLVLVILTGEAGARAVWGSGFAG